jgi:hypothetical protein
MVAGPCVGFVAPLIILNQWADFHGIRYEHHDTSDTSTEVLTMAL